MNDRLERLKEIQVENYVYIIYIGIIFLSWYANKKEKEFFLYNNQRSKKEYQNLLILIFTILLLIYIYFTKDSYDALMKLNVFDSNKKKGLTYASFIGSVLILISGVLFLIIAISDSNIDTEIAFS